MRGIVTDDGQPGDHPLFVLFKGRKREPGQAVVAGFLPLGRCYRPDELEVIPKPPRASGFSTSPTDGAADG